MAEGEDSRETFAQRMKRRDSGWKSSSALSSTRYSPGQPKASVPRGAELTGVRLPTNLLNVGERGIVWSDSEASWLRDGGLSISAPTVDEVSLRTALLFADRVALPENNCFAYDPPSAALLKPFDILDRPFCSYSGRIESALMREAADSFVHLDKREPGLWTIARSAKSMPIPSAMLSTKQGFSVTLRDALPVFAREVSMDDVLAHKERRRDELQQLRHYLDGIIAEATKSGVNDLASSKAFLDFDKALAEHMATMRESNLSKVLTSFRASISWDLAIPAATEFALTHTAAGSGVIGAGAVLAFNTIRGLTGRKSVSPFEYLTTVSRELY